MRNAQGDAATGKMGTHADDHDDQHERQTCKHRPLEPQLAVLEVEPHLEHVAHELGVMGELLAHASAGGAYEGAVGRHGSEEGAEGKVCDGVVTVKPDMRGFMLPGE